MPKPNSTKLIIASLKTGKEMKISQRDYLLVSQYAESIGMKLEIVGRDKSDFTIKASFWNCKPEEQ